MDRGRELLQLGHQCRVAVRVIRIGRPTRLLEPRVLEMYFSEGRRRRRLLWFSRQAVPQSYNRYNADINCSTGARVYRVQVFVHGPAGLRQLLDEEAAADHRRDSRITEAFKGAQGPRRPRRRRRTGSADDEDADVVDAAAGDRRCRRRASAPEKARPPSGRHASHAGEILS